MVGIGTHPEEHYSLPLLCLLYIISVVYNVYILRQSTDPAATLALLVV